MVWRRGDPAVTRLGADQALANGPADVLVPANADGDAVCASQYGNAAGGDIAYVGTCDASSDADGDAGNGVQNVVTVWFDGLYNTGLSQDVGGWQDPCPNGCALNIDCVENRDTLAAFDFTVLRENTEGLYVGVGGNFKKGTPDEVAINEDLSDTVAAAVPAVIDIIRAEVAAHEGEDHPGH